MSEHSERYWEARWRDEKATNDALVKALEGSRDAIRAVYREIDNPAMPACLAAAWEVSDLALSRVG